MGRSLTRLQRLFTRARQIWQLAKPISSRSMFLEMSRHLLTIKDRDANLISRICGCVLLHERMALAIRTGVWLNFIPGMFG